ncbi:MAG TPA: hypothetical protein VMY88_11450 [Acidimicrobiales bacterium]|nr:hypothetical protein [Acidimicrobiales bacterium]
MQDPQRERWLSAHLMLAGSGSRKRRARAAARAAKVSSLRGTRSRRRSSRLSISATQRASSFSVMPAGMSTRTTPSRSSAEIV